VATVITGRLSRESLVIFSPVAIMECDPNKSPPLHLLDTFTQNAEQSTFQIVSSASSSTTSRSLFQVLDLSLFRNFIPVELRKIVKIFVYASTDSDELLRRAVKMWCSPIHFQALQLYGPISSWETGNVTNMSNLFSTQIAPEFRAIFNEPLDGWDVSNVKTMMGTFAHCTSFNQPLNSWQTNNVEDMSFMFDHARAFNQPLNHWNVNKVKHMNNMLQFATAFNQYLANWDVSNVVTIVSMFCNAESFNQPYLE
jgi:surface protein